MNQFIAASASNCSQAKSTLPFYRPGLGLRSELSSSIEQNRHRIGFLEVTPENYFNDVRSIEWLETFSEGIPLLSHSVSLSLGSIDELDGKLLQQLRWFAGHFNTAWVSDHLSFSSVNGQYSYDLFPLPFSRNSARYVADRILAAQEKIGRPLIIENIPYYVDSPEGDLREAEFISTVAEFADCCILLDLNNILVNSINHKFDAQRFVQSLPLERVVQIHMAGHARYGDRAIDTHGASIAEIEFEMLQSVLQAVPVNGIMIERDQRFPAFQELLDELDKIIAIQDQCDGTSATRSDSLSEVSQLRTAQPVFVDDAMEYLRSYQENFFKNWAETTVPSEIESILSDKESSGIDVYAWLRDQTRLSTIASIYPFCRSIVGAQFNELVDAYLKTHPCQDQNILKMGELFPSYLSSVCVSMSLPRFLPELADYELIHHSVRTVQKHRIEAPEFIQLQSYQFLGSFKPVLAPGMVLRSYNHAISKLIWSLQNASTLQIPEFESAEHLAIYPRPEGREPAVLELSIDALRILALATKGKNTYLELMASVLKEGASSDELAALIKLLRRLHENGAFISARACSSETDQISVKCSDWSQFYEKTSSATPHATVIRALEEWQRLRAGGSAPGLCVDLGAGAGRDTLLLLEQGWSVLAIDADTSGLEALASALDPTLAPRLEILRANMEEVEFPSIELLNASLSLPFCPPASFDRLWAHIVVSIKPGGFFCGHFFGPRDQWADQLSVHSAEKLRDMLKPFSIVLFEEQQGMVPLAMGGEKRSHVFSIVAIKN